MGTNSKDEGNGVFTVAYDKSNKHQICRESQNPKSHESEGDGIIQFAQHIANNVVVSDAVINSIVDHMNTANEGEKGEGMNDIDDIDNNMRAINDMAIITDYDEEIKQTPFDGIAP